MLLRLNDDPVIDNLRNYPPEVVEKLRRLLTSGAPAQIDSRRPDFYLVENGSRAFYLHISPSGKVLLLGSWPSENTNQSTPEARHVVATGCRPQV